MSHQMLIFKPKCCQRFTGKQDAAMMRNSLLLGIALSIVTLIIATHF